MSASSPPEVARREAPPRSPHRRPDAAPRLLQRLSRIEGKFLLSGYDHRLYHAAAERWGWHRHEFEVANHAAGGEAKRRMTEVVWTNFTTPTAQIASAEDMVDTTACTVTDEHQIAGRRRVGA